VRPQITGTPKPGATLTCSDGTWTNAPTSFTHQWKRDGVNIAGAGNATYAVDPADVGHQVTCVVTADNAAGTGHASSDAVVPANDVPVNVGPPALSRDGQALSCTNGTWSNAPTSFVLQWLRDGAEVAGANTATYVLSDADQGHAIRCRVTARNAVGSAVAMSDAVDVPVPACTTCATSSAPTTTTPPSMSPSTIPVVPPPPADATAPSARVAASKRLRAATGHGAAGQRVTLRLRLSRAQLQRARRVLRRGGHVTATVTITATDAAGNRSGTRSRVMLR
jgi:hypothetical protein